MSQSKTEQVFAVLRAHAEATGGEAKSPSEVMAETGTSRNLVWTCTSMLRQAGIVTKEKLGRAPIERNVAMQRIQSACQSFGRPLNVGEIRSMFTCSYATARKLKAEHAVIAE